MMKEEQFLNSETGQIYIAGSTITTDDVALPYLTSSKC